MGKLTKKKFLGIDPSRIGNMKVPELRELLRGARQLFKSQQSMFKKHEKSVFSFALDKMEDFYDRKGEKAVSRMNKRDMGNELYHIQEFFKSETSTIPGVRRVFREQDARIFGVDEEGNPKKRLTFDQRTNLWAAYNEFKLLEKESYVRNMGSNTTQQELAGMVIEMYKNHPDSDFMFGSGDFAELKRRLEERQAEEARIIKNEDSGDVYSGKRPY